MNVLVSNKALGNNNGVDIHYDIRSLPNIKREVDVQKPMQGSPTWFFRNFLNRQIPAYSDKPLNYYVDATMFPKGSLLQLEQPPGPGPGPGPGPRPKVVLKPPQGPGPGPRPKVVLKPPQGPPPPLQFTFTSQLEESGTKSAQSGIPIVEKELSLSLLPRIWEEEMFSEDIPPQDQPPPSHVPQEPSQGEPASRPVVEKSDLSNRLNEKKKELEKTERKRGRFDAHVRRTLTLW